MLYCNVAKQQNVDDIQYIKKHRIVKIVYMI